ncbi:arabinosidase [Infundibulicybe gibba]|nr:arabinosidase [Infundibulicybe gibba]
MSRNNQLTEDKKATHHTKIRTKPKERCNMYHSLFGYFIFFCSCLHLVKSIPFETAADSNIFPARYLFTAFTNSSETDLYVYTSDDATNFSLLKGPAYTPKTGVLRDPSIIHHTDGKYYIAYTTNWNGTDFAIANSNDLLTWNLVTTVSTKSSVIVPFNTWAPEFFKDPKTGKLNIIVSLSTGQYGPFLPYVYTALDESLTRWSGPVVMQGISNAGLGYIDTFPLFHNDEYHLFTKAESLGQKHIEHATSSRLTGPYTFVQQGDFAGWGEAEGPCVTQLPDGKFRLYADGFNTGRYIYSDSADLYNWTSLETLPVISGTVRHGTVLKQF